MNIFIGLIISLINVNDTFIIYNLWNKVFIIKIVLDKNKLFEKNELNYEPSIFESKTSFFVFIMIIIWNLC